MSDIHPLSTMKLLGPVVTSQSRDRNVPVIVIRIIYIVLFLSLSLSLFFFLSFCFFFLFLYITHLRPSIRNHMYIFISSNIWTVRSRTFFLEMDDYTPFLFSFIK